MRYLTIFVVVLICLVACSKSVTKEDYQKIKTGMNKTQVIEILGNPESLAETGEIEILHYQSNDAFGGAKAISITIQNGRVFDKQWTEI